MTIYAFIVTILLTLPTVQTNDRGYRLGPDDQVTVWVLGVEDIARTPVRIDPQGYVDLPMAGRIKAAGLTAQELKEEIARTLKTFVQDPQVSVSIVEYRSQPVSVIGAVKDPGIVQVQGRKTLVEVLSLAGGPRPDASDNVVITRRKEFGPIPLPGAKEDATGQFNVADVKLKTLLEAKSPVENITIQPHDVIAVPRAAMVYVMGEVTKPGAFALNEHEALSVLQALSMAGGVTKVAASGNAKILRTVPASVERQEIAINLTRLLSGKAEDLQLRADDILFVPNSRSKSVGLRAAEAAMQIGIGTVIWRR